MKRLITLLLIAALMISLCSCQKEETDGIAFYYLRTEDTIAYGSQHALIAPVIQEISGQNAQIDYLLRMYLNGPQSDKFHSPFPSGTYLINTEKRENTLIVTLSDEFSTLKDIDLSLAAACLSATCFDLTEAEQIRVRSGDMTLDCDRNSFTLLDELTPTE